MLRLVKLRNLPRSSESSVASTVSIYSQKKRSQKEISLEEVKSDKLSRHTSSESSVRLMSNFVLQSGLEVQEFCLNSQNLNFRMP